MLNVLNKAFTKATLFGKEVMICPAANDHIAVIPSSTDEKPLIMTKAQFNLSQARGNLVFTFDVPDELPQAANQTDQQRLAQDLLFQYVSRMKQEKYSSSRRVAQMIINEVKRELEDNDPPSVSTLLRAIKKHSEYGNLHHLPRKNPQRFHDVAYDLFTEIIDDMYLILNGASVAECWAEYEKQAKLNLEGEIKYFSRSTFYKHVKQLSRIEVLAAREGKKVSRNDSRIVYRNLITSRILERIEMDAVHINIGLLDENGDIITQVILYAMIDCYSRSILGYHLHVKKKHKKKQQQGENKTAILQNLIHSFSPKPDMNFVNGKYHWNMYGSGENYITDAGGAYSSHDIGAFISAAGGDQHIAEAGAGYRKPYIERFFGTLRTQCLSVLPGYMGKREDRKEYDHPIQKQAVLTLKEFEALIANYIVTRYHQNPHKGLGMNSPQQVWDEALDNSTTILRVHDTGRLIRQNITPTKRTIQGHKGVQFNNTFYNARALKDLYDALTQKGDKNPQIECIFTELEPDQAWAKNPLTGTLIMLKEKVSQIKTNDVSEEDSIPGSDEQFGFHHPLIVNAREQRDASFEAIKANKTKSPLNTKEITDQRYIFDTQSKNDTAPSFDSGHSDDSTQVSVYDEHTNFDDEDEFEGVDVDDH